MESIFVVLGIIMVIILALVYMTYRIIRWIIHSIKGTGKKVKIRVTKTKKA